MRDSLLTGFGGGGEFILYGGLGAMQARNAVRRRRVRTLFNEKETPQQVARPLRLRLRMCLA